MSLPENFSGVVIFSAPWCGPCKTYKPLLQKVCRTHERDLLEINVDADRPLAGQFSVKAVPSTLLFAEGLEIRRFTGAMTEAKLTEFIQS